MIDYDLVVVGAGSGNMLPKKALDGRRIAIIERGPFGGTCLNRGCIPSKMLVYAADVAESVRTAGRYGIRAELLGVDWPAVRDRVFDRTDRASEETLEARRQSGVDVYVGEARFVEPRVLEVDGQRVRGERVVVAAGSRPTVPEIAGLAGVPFHTTDTIMRVDALPRSMVIVGGGAVAAELGHMFGAFGTDVTIVEQEAMLLSALDDDVARQFTARARERFDVRVSTKVTRVERTEPGVAVHLEHDAESSVVEAEVLLLAVGRTPNTDVLDAAAGGLALDDRGKVVTDDAFATNVPGVWAIGDLTNRIELKHLANAEMRIAMENILHGNNTRRDAFAILPSAVFADPQIGTVGPTERALREAGKPYVAARSDYADAAFGWALEDTTGFAKLIADPATRRLLAAHVVGPQAATLVQPLVQAMFLDNTVDQLAKGVLYVHPAAPEIISQALLKLVAALG
jgi:mycothione reductase